jgi:hypothetical protein
MLICTMLGLKKLRADIQVHVKVVLVFIGIVVAIVIIQELLK